MSDSQPDKEAVRTDEEPGRADLNPLRAAGWHFRDGDCIAIERQSEDVGTGAVAD